MPRTAKRIFWTVGLVLAGAILGPVVFAAASAALVAKQDGSPLHRRNEADLLIDAYRSRLPVGIMFMTVMLPEDGKECGYKPEQVFPNAFDELEIGARQKRYTDYLGYWVLDHWRNKTQDEEWLSAVAQEIDNDFSDFEAGFLRRCIQATVFSPLCMNRVAPYGDRVERFDHKRPASPMRGFGIEDQIVCTYVDGVAARRGIKVPSSRS